MVYDCFTFFNELELLELRLHELEPVVDRFVLVEATLTHSCKPKPLYFEENKSAFRRFLPKIIHIIVSDFPPFTGDRWIQENFQRNAIARGLKDCRPDDVVIVSDVDEIVRAQAVSENIDKPGVKFFQQKLFYYFLNCQQIKSVWDRPKMVFYRDLRSPQWLRDYPNPSISQTSKIEKKVVKYKHRLMQLLGPKDIYIENGGWHFSYLGGIERIQQKINAFAHSEFDKTEFLQPDKLQSSIELGEDLYKRKGIKFELIPIDDSLPSYLLNNIGRYNSLIKHPVL